MQYVTIGMPYLYMWPQLTEKRASVIDNVESGMMQDLLRTPWHILSRA